MTYEESLNLVYQTNDDIINPSLLRCGTPGITIKYKSIQGV